MLRPADYIQVVKDRLSEEGNPDRAFRQIKYMKYQFEYYGLPAKHWLALFKDIFMENGYYNSRELREFCELCFEDEYREIQYLAIEMYQKKWKEQSAEQILLLEYMIIHRSWWDTVDWIAKIVGFHFQKFPDLIERVNRSWMDSGNMWLQRTAIIFQLKYGINTDQELLFSNILKVSNSREFFLRKASGWALRQYSKSNPTAVIQFVESHPELSGLTQREALRLIDRNLY